MAEEVGALLERGLSDEEIIARLEAEGMTRIGAQQALAIAKVERANESGGSEVITV